LVREESLQCSNTGLDSWCTNTKYRKRVMEETLPNYERINCVAQPREASNVYTLICRCDKSVYTCGLAGSQGRYFTAGVLGPITARQAFIL
jgi:hypothetical protein